MYVASRPTSSNSCLSKYYARHFTHITSSTSDINTYLHELKRNHITNRE